MNNRDNLSSSDHATSGGDVNRQTSQNQRPNDTTAEFGQKIGRSENQMNEPSRRSGSVGESGMSGSPGSTRDSSRMSNENRTDTESKNDTWGSGSSNNSSRH
jgi:hypothetical protein